MHQPGIMEFFPKSSHGFTNELSERVECALRRCPQLCGYSIDCQQYGDKIVLTGSVRSYYLKQIAQTVAGGVNGVSRVINDVDVIAGP